MRDDRELLAAWREGDAQAGERLFERHFDAIYRFFRSKLDGDVADLVQQTFLAAVEAQDSFRGASSLRTFLFAIARRKLYRHLRDRYRDQRLDFEVSSLVELGMSPASVQVERAEQRLLLEALRTIPVELQTIVELHYWEGLRGPELAEVLGIPEGTVRSRLRRALERLRAALAELAESSAVLESTTSNLDRWATSLREALPARP